MFHHPRVYSVSVSTTSHRFPILLWVNTGREYAYKQRGFSFRDGITNKEEDDNKGDEDDKDDEDNKDGKDYKDDKEDEEDKDNKEITNATFVQDKARVLKEQKRS
ncbi:hypothetical protein C8R42DRAFT_713851 [Lentinula raphanica]|nr:hypothetical protein C8R42DRAFT_713851 [Lentinula raphanica]